jgi:hypothetical protein
MRGRRDAERPDLPVWLDESDEIDPDAAIDLLQSDESRIAGLLRSRAARAVTIVVLLIVLGSATVWRVVDRPHSTPAAAPPPAAAPSANALPAPPRHHPSHAYGSGAIAQVLGQAHNAVTDYVRQTSPPGACPFVPMGRAPATRIRHALATAFPELRHVRIGSTLDEYTALCAVSARALYREAVVTLSIMSPQPRKQAWRYARLETGILTVGAVTTEYALDVSRTGWRVLVGASGPAEALPGSNELLHFAQQGRRYS